jgi:crotonobetainyl-CoA:carnitine CoA-transferase CaiB-like acyl-CoA transferase
MALLNGIRVVEWAVLFNGGFVGSLLGDLGAEVVKVETPWRGDYLRDSLGQITPHNSPSHLQINKNKRSLTLDVSRPEGRDVFWRLFASADVFVDGTAGDGLSRLGVGYEEQRRRKPDIVYCQVSGFGRGPYANIPSHGEMMNALAAARPQEMGDDGLPRPKPANGSFGGTTFGARGSVAAGLFGVQYVLAGLVHRDRTGEGCFIDVSGADAVVASAWQGALYDLNDDRIVDRSSIPARDDDGKNRAATYGFFETADGLFVMFAALEPKFWSNFCRAIGRPDLERQVDASQPMDFEAGSDALRHELQRIFRSRPLDEWTKLAAEHTIPIAPAYGSVVEAVDDPHVRQRNIFVPGEHPVAGPFTYVGRPAQIDGHPFEVRYPAPALGEHTDEVLTELGLGATEIADLRSRRIV